MKKILLLTFLSFALHKAVAQCPTSSTPTSNCSTNQEYIAYFGINNITVGSNTVCSPNGYAQYAAPVWTLNVGSSYNWTVFTTSHISLGGDNSIAMWIDYNNDGQFTGSEKVFSFTNSLPQPSGSQNYFGSQGLFSVPQNAVTGIKLKLRLRTHSGVYPHNDPCSSYPNGSLNGETEDYWVYLTCPSMNLSISPANAAVCSGSHVTVSASGASGYTWQPGNSHSSVQNFSPTANTQYTLYAENSQGCVTAMTYDVLVNAAPVIQVSGGITAVCAGSSATLNVSGTGNYQWQPGGNFGPTNVVNPSAATAYTVKDLSTNCTASTSISVNQLPNVTASVGSPVICFSTAASFQAAGASTYTWSINNITGNNISPVLTTGGSYTVTGEDQNGCRNTAVVNIVVNPGAAFNYTCTNMALTVFNASPPGLSGFTWDFGDKTVSTQVQPGTHVYTSAGTYTVKLSAVSPAPCPDVTTSFVLKMPSKIAGGTGISETQSSENTMSVFPNPAKNVLYIRYEGLFDPEASAEIYTATGSLVKTVLLETQTAEPGVDLSELTSGAYFLKLRTGGTTVIKPFIKH